MKKNLLVTLLILMSAVSSAQNMRYVTEYSTFGNYPLTGKTFYIASGNSNIPTNDLEFQYYSDIIKQCLLRQKAIPTNDYDGADFCVLLDYGITDKSYTATRTIPIWGQTGIASVTTTSRTNANAYGSSYGSASAYGYSSGNSAYGTASGSIYGSANGSSTTTTTQNYNYNYGVTGYHEQTYNVTEYRRVLNLYAYDNKKRDGEPVMIWKANATSDGSSHDLSNVFVYMANEICNELGKNSKGLKEYYTLDCESDVLCMKQQLYSSNNVVVNPTNYNTDNGCKSIWLRAVGLFDDGSIIYLLGIKRDDGRNLKVSNKTYLIYRGNKYHVSYIDVPFAYGTDTNMLNKVIPLYTDYKTLIRMFFPIGMQKGDSFDIVSYKDKKETKELFHIKNIILE